MDLWEDLEEVAGLQNNPAYVQLWEDKCYQGGFQIHSLEEPTEVSEHELTTAAKCTGIQLLEDNGLCPLKLFSHCDIKFAPGWYIQ